MSSTSASKARYANSGTNVPTRTTTTTNTTTARSSVATDKFSSLMDLLARSEIDQSTNPSTTSTIPTTTTTTTTNNANNSNKQTKLEPIQTTVTKAVREERRPRSITGRTITNTATDSIQPTPSQTNGSTTAPAAVSTHPVPSTPTRSQQRWISQQSSQPTPTSGVGSTVVAPSPRSLTTLNQQRPTPLDVRTSAPLPVPASPSSSNSYSSETFSPLASLLSPRSVRQATSFSVAAAASATDATTQLSRSASQHASATSTVSTATSLGANSATSSTNIANSHLPLDSLKSKLVGLKSELSTKDTTINQLKSQISSLELERVQATSRFNDQLLSQKRDFEELLSRNQNFVETILKDKAELNTKCENLATRIVSMEEEYTKKEQQFRRETLAVELQKAKDAWIASEKITREKFLETRTKQIKAETLRSLEPEIQSLLAKAKVRSQESESALERRHAQQLADVRSDHEQLIASIRKQHGVAIEHAREEERVAAQKRIRETIEKYDKQMMDQRQRYQAELETARTQASTSSTTIQQAVDSALFNQRKEHLFEVSQLKATHQQTVDDLNRRSSLRETSERERIAIEQESWSSMMHAKLQREFQEKERQARVRLDQEHREEIELIIEKLTKENDQQCQQIIKEYEQKLDGMRRSLTHTCNLQLERCTMEYHLSSSELNSTKKSLSDLQTKYESDTRNQQKLESTYQASSTELTSCRRELQSKTSQLESQTEKIKQLERQVNTIQKETKEQFVVEKHQLRTQYQLMQSKLDELQQQLTNQTKSHQLDLANTIQAKEKDHAAQLESMQTRVKELLLKKDGVIDSLKRQVQELQLELQTQQRELMEQINS